MKRQAKVSQTHKNHNFADDNVLLKMEEIPSEVVINCKLQWMSHYPYMVNNWANKNTTEDYIKFFFVYEKVNLYSFIMAVSHFTLHIKDCGVTHVLKIGIYINY